jgi:riboflavin synthase
VARTAALAPPDGAAHQAGGVVDDLHDRIVGRSLDVVTVPGAPADLVGAAQVLIEHGCQKQLDLLVDSASKYSAAQK